MSILIFFVFQLLNIKIEIFFHPLAISLFFISLALSFYLGLCISAFAFWLIEMWPLRRFFQGCMALFGGIIAPLDLLPTSIKEIANFTPFPYLGYLNVKALQGSIPVDGLLQHCIIGFVWTILFAIGFKVLWNLGLKRYEAVNI
jgi:ABC-2 type transport system permease protein